MEIVLDGNKITNKKDLFETLKKQVKSEEFYGNNLDALWDVLTVHKEPLTIKIINEELLNKHLEDYYNKLLELFNDLKDSNNTVTILK